MATQRAVLLPEIVQCIAENTVHGAFLEVDYKGDLFQYLTVNHVWYTEAVRVLWRHIKLEYLWCLPFSRRQYFANMVVGLKIHSEYGRIEDGITRKERRWFRKNRSRLLKFPRLEMIHFDLRRCDIPDGVFIQYFVPTLRMVWIYSPSNGLLNALAARCKDLNEVSLPYNPESSADVLNNFLSNCRARRLELRHTSGSLIDIMASKDNLEELFISSISPENLEGLFKLQLSGNDIFKSLVSFSCISHLPTPVDKILRIMPMLKNVRLRVPDIDIALVHLARRPLLERVKLIAFRGRVSPKGVKAFVEQHNTLTELYLRVADKEVANDGVNDAFMQEITRFLPLLEHLTLSLSHQITCKALLSICGNCPFLKTLDCSFLWDTNVKSLESGAFSRYNGPPLKNLRNIQPHGWLFDIPRWELKKYFPLCYHSIRHARADNRRHDA